MTGPVFGLGTNLSPRRAHKRRPLKRNHGIIAASDVNGRHLRLAGGPRCSDFVLAAAKKRERQPCYCKALSGALERGVARACLAGRRRRRQPPRRAAERARDTERLSHTRRPEGVRTHERQSRRQPPRGASGRCRTQLARESERERRSREPRTNPASPRAAAHSVKQEPQEARLRVGGPRPHRQAPQASWGKR